MTDLSSLMESPIEKLTPQMLGGLKVESVADAMPWINALFYADSGIGKTWLAGSASAVEELSPVLLIDIEGGKLTLREEWPKVETVRVQSWEEMQKLYDELYKGNPYKTLLFDSLTEIQKFSMYEIMKVLAKEGRSSGAPVDEDVPGMREWGKNLEQVRKMVRAFRDLPCNTIFTALVASEKNARTGKTHMKPSLPGKLGGEVAAFVDIVGYLYMKEMDDEMKRFMLFNATEEQIAKDRSNKLPMVMEAPTMEKIHTTIFSAKAA